MLSCKKVTMLVSESQERTLSLGEKAQLKLHLLICSACNNFDKNLKTMRVAMGRFNTAEMDSDSNNKHEKK